MLTTEGTYPFHRGGVSTWCDLLVNRVNGVDFVVYSVLMNPFVRQKFELPAHVQLVKLPLWGTEEPLEHLIDVPFSRIYAAKRRTRDEVIRTDFLPLLADLLNRVLNGREGAGLEVSRTLHRMYQYFREYDYQATFKSQPVWDLFKQLVLKRTRVNGNGRPPASLFDAAQTLGWVYRFLVPLANPLPRVDVTHSSAAAICGVPCILSKFEHGTPYLLTEHGVYLREQYIAVNRRQDMSSYCKDFLVSLVGLVARASYETADQISPVCAFNTRWERRFGVSEDRISVIYNGVDPAVFAPPARLPDVRRRPTVVAVARIDPIKDIEGLIRAAVTVREQVPDVQFIIYGGVSVPDYYQRCLEVRAQLGLDTTVIFAGHADDVAAAYHTGDVAVLSSISEGFPYSVIEAMMSGKAVVATDVGGVREALGDCGLLVPPRRPEELARSIVRLLKDPGLRRSLGQDARERALAYFTVASFLHQYLQSYINLYDLTSGRPGTELARNRQRLLADRGYALLELGMWEESRRQFQLAVEADPASLATPVLLLELAGISLQLGDLDRALLEMEKAEVLAAVLEAESDRAGRKGAFAG
jgi:glycosyltransferase involved in cell wall biosynthesis